LNDQGIKYDRVAWSLLLGLVLLANGLIELLQVCPSLICFAPDIVYGQVKILFETKQDDC
jgi:hypothetical protein